MHAPTWTPDGAPPAPPPLWLVSDGASTVGPVSTTDLVRSAERGLSRRFHVRATRSWGWRPLADLREVRRVDETAWDRKQRLTRMNGLLARESLLRLTDRADDTLDLGLEVAAGRLGADFGFVHCFERGRLMPRTRFGFGVGASSRVGAPLLPMDTLGHVARAQHMAMGDARAHHAFRVAASRLGGRAAEVIGVAMAPLAVHGEVVAMLELGRIDRPFRFADRHTLRTIARLVSSRLPSA